MFERLRRLYQEERRINMNGLINAVKSKLISEDQFYRICNVTYDEATGNKPGEGKNAPEEVTDNG